MKVFRCLAYLIFTIPVVLSSLAYAAPGDLDATFNPSNGVVTYDSGNADWGNAVTLQADGRIIVAGWSSNGTNYDFALLRYNTDGSLDTGFGTGGVATYDNGNDDRARDVTLQADGRIIVVGDSHNGADGDIAVLRYNADGSLDTSFGTNGVVTYDGGSFDTGRDVAVQADGRIVVVGYNDNGTDLDLVVLRYNTDGSLDTGFGTNGVATYDNGSGGGGFAVAVQADGRIIVAGDSHNGSNYDINVLRYNTDGSLDTSFGTGGVATHDNGGQDHGYTIAVQTDGRIVVAGRSGNGTDPDLVVLRYNANGSLDTGFGTSGVVIYDNGSNDRGHDVAVQADGRIVVTGFINNGTNYDVLVLRCNANGALDTSFGTNGVAIYDNGYGDEGSDLTVQANGQIVAAGRSNSGINNDVAVLRYNTDGSLDTSFGTGGVAIYDNGNNDQGDDVAIQDDGRIIVAGRSSNSVDMDIAVMRYNTDGSLDTSFGTNGVATYDSGNDDYGWAAAVQADGRIVVVGYSHNGSDDDFVVLRYNTNGSLDTSFGTAGVVFYDNGGGDRSRAVALQTDGKILISGYSHNGTNTDNVVLRYNTDGSLDTSFGTGGVATYDSGQSDYGRVLTLQDDGRIIVAGYSHNGSSHDLVVLRYNTDGSLDTSFGTGGVTIYDGGQDDRARFVTLQDDGRIVVAGYSHNGSDYDFTVLRYNTDGSLDTNFGNGGVATYDGGNGDNGYAVTVQSDDRIIAVGASSNGTDTDLVVLSYNTDGSLDTGFGTSGVAIYDGGGNDYGFAVALQSDSQIVVSGSRYNGSNYDTLTIRFDDTVSGTSGGGGGGGGGCFISTVGNITPR